MLEDYSFLVGHDADTLALAITTSATWHVQPHQMLIATGIVMPDAYVAELGSRLNATVLGEHIAAPAATALVDATAFSPAQVARLAADYRRRGQDFALTTPAYIAATESSTAREIRLNAAIKGLVRRNPELSATGPVWLWQSVIIVSGIGIFIGAALIAPAATRAALMACIAVPFFFIVVFRLAAVCLVLAHPLPREPKPKPARRDGDLPVYSVLVPLFREAAVLPDLVRALSAIDYPAAKLDCMLVLEASDVETIAAATATMLPPFVRIVLVPDSEPRTKPKALNYAIRLARGSFVVVYDAEDVPHPDQLRAALDVFKMCDSRVVCVQARLAIHNAKSSWLTRGIMAHSPQELNPSIAHIHGHERAIEQVRNGSAEEEAGRRFVGHPAYGAPASVPPELSDPSRRHDQAA